MKQNFRILNCLLFSILIILTVFKIPFFENNINLKEVTFIIVFSIWGIIAVFLTEKRIPISIIDVCLLILLIYIITNFSLFSQATFYFTQLWVILSSYIAFYVFTWVLKNDKSSNVELHYILILIVISSLAQSIISLMQEWGYLKVDNEYFTLLGSFSSPNYLAAYSSFGLIVMIWYLFVFKIKNKLYLISGIISSIIILITIILSNSRGTWVSLIGVCIVLSITSKKNIKFIKNLSIRRKVIASSSIILLLIIGGTFIYSLNTKSVSGRSLILKIAGQETFNKPILGHGLYNFAGSYNRVKSNYFNLEERTWEEVKVGNYVYTAFNDYLLIAYELGIPFLLIITFLLIFLLFKVKVNTQSRIGISITVFLSIWVLFNSLITIPAFLLIGLFGFSIVFNNNNLPSRVFLLNLNIQKSIIIKVFILSICITSLFFISNKIYGIEKFENYSIREISDINKDTLLFLSKSMENNRNNLFNLGKNLYELGFKDDGYRLIEEEFCRTSHPKIAKYLAYQYTNDGNYSKAENMYLFNIGVEPFRYEWQMNLISLKEKHNNYSEVVALSKKIINFPVKIPSKKIEDYKSLSKKKIQKYSKYSDSTSLLKGTLSKSFLVKSDLLDVRLLYKIYLPSISKIKGKLPVVYINNGQSYIDKWKAAHVLDSLIHNEVIKPVAAIFIEPRSINRELHNTPKDSILCNSGITDFFTKEFMLDIEKKYPISQLRVDKTIMGAFSGASTAIYLATESSSDFKNIVIQLPDYKFCRDIYTSLNNTSEQDFNIYMSYFKSKQTNKQDSLIQYLREKDYTLKLNPLKEKSKKSILYKKDLEEVFIYLNKLTT